MRAGIATQVIAATAVGSLVGAATMGGLPLCKAVATAGPAARIKLCFRPGDVSMELCYTSMDVSALADPILGSTFLVPAQNGSSS
jgi:hypothetical protein